MLRLRAVAARGLVARAMSTSIPVNHVARIMRMKVRAPRRAAPSRVTSKQGTACDLHRSAAAFGDWRRCPGRRMR